MIVLLIISQILFSFMRVLNIKYIQEQKTILTLSTSLIIKSTAIFSTYIGIKAIIDSNYYFLIVYLLSGTLGEYIAIKFKSNGKVF